MNIISKVCVFREQGDELVAALRDRGITAGHFTNGTYIDAPQKPDLMVPTTLAGFKNVTDHEREEEANTPLILAVNSDKSMLLFFAKKFADDPVALQGAKERMIEQDQEVRAMAVAAPLARQNPGRRVAVVFYDEETPNALYAMLNKAGFGMRTLHKLGGYGLTPDAPVIEGAEHFGRVYASPLPNMARAFCEAYTRAGGQEAPEKIAVVNLVGKYLGVNPSGKSYCLFAMLHPDLLVYGKSALGYPVLHAQGRGPGLGCK